MTNDLFTRAWSFLRSRVSHHFFNCRVTREDTAQTILAQRDHAKLGRFLFDRDSGRPFVNQFTDWVGDSQKLVNSLPSFVAGIVAGIATFSVEELFPVNVAPGDTEFCEQGVTRPARRATTIADTAQ